MPGDPHRRRRRPADRFPVLLRGMGLPGKTVCVGGPCGHNAARGPSRTAKKWGQTPFLAFLRRKWGLTPLFLLTACAGLDPHNVIGRQIGEASGMVATEVVPSPRRGLDAAAREKAFDFVWTTIEERYYDPR